ncbi:MAG: hypothetical protein JWN67_973 [Actinomycetia bacterium]|nr:hypothetical protein [Actinomycetes bacterium]
MTDPIARSVEIIADRYFYDRLRQRLEGLTDDEYLWSPVAECLTVTGEPGRVAWGTPGFTTIAWRIAHLSEGFRAERAWRWLGREPAFLDADIRHPTTAAGAITELETNYTAWHDLLGSLGPDELWQPIGPIGGPLYGDSERLTFVFHVVDELIHHAAEIGVLRDLYAATVTT